MSKERMSQENSKNVTDDPGSPIGFIEIRVTIETGGNHRREGVAKVLILSHKARPSS